MYVCWCPTQFAHQMMCSRCLAITRRVILTVQELIIRPEHLDSTREYSCCSIFNFLCRFLSTIFFFYLFIWPSYCLSFSIYCLVMFRYVGNNIAVKHSWNQSVIFVNLKDSEWIICRLSVISCRFHAYQFVFPLQCTLLNNVYTVLQSSTL